MGLPDLPLEEAELPRGVGLGGGGGLGEEDLDLFGSDGLNGGRGDLSLLALPLSPSEGDNDSSIESYKRSLEGGGGGGGEIVCKDE